MRRAVCFANEDRDGGWAWLRRRQSNGAETEVRGAGQRVKRRWAESHAAALLREQRRRPTVAAAAGYGGKERETEEE
ncbi:hypothetical protein Csa_022667 [Cucumis sativus]|nr:hypothetical protein Csa_022667 [Cucumis sativus]